MKKISGLIVAIILLISCSKEAAQNSDTELLNDNIKSVISQSTISTLKQSQSLLTSEERQNLWSVKFQSILKNDAQQLSKEQKNIVIMVKEFLEKNNIAGLLKNPYIGDDFLSTNMTYFEKNFTKQQLYMLIELPYFADNFSIFKSEEYLKNLRIVPIDGDAADCECRYSISCGWGSYCIDNDKCTQVASCGIAGTSRCTGECN
jgi:hypothetical protein